MRRGLTRISGMLWSVKEPKLVIVGGVAAGASAAAKARRTCEEVHITMVEAGPYISFANCGLPYFLGGEIARRESLFVAEAGAFGRRFNVDVRTSCRVVAVDPEGRQVRLESGELLDYDRLILATGTHAVRPPVEGLDIPNIFMVRTVPDVDAIVEWKRRIIVPEGQPARALVVGAGYIGLETAEQFHRTGMQVTVLELSDQVMVTMDPEMTLPLTSMLREQGLEVILGDALQKVEDDGKGGTVAITRNGRRISFDMGILAVGVRPNVELAVSAGLALGPTGAIQVDSFQRTSNPFIYAAGDNSEAHHLVAGCPANIPLAGPANRMGRTAGVNAALDLAGAPDDDPRRLRFKGVLGTAVVRVFDRIAALTGLTEKQAKRYGIPYQVAYMFGNSHAGYYPGADLMTLKALYDPESGRVLGVQGVGGKGVDKRVDVAATAITGGLTVEDMEDLELCYAPPVGSAKDVANLAGFAAANTRRGVMPSLTPYELLEAVTGPEPPLVLDVRTPAEHAEGHLPGAINLPLDELRQRLDEVPHDRPLALHCRSGYRSYLAQRILLNHGYREVRNIQGGWLLMQWCGAPSQTKA